MSDIKYLIQEQTLKDIADSLRSKGETSDEIKVGQFAERISKIEPSVEEYMRISDYSSYPKAIIEEDYDEKNIKKCKDFIDFYARMEDITNG